ncbi:MAG: reverse transcriptase family protein, partial [Bacteroidota bacterium]
SSIQNWRNTIRELGREYAIILDMIQLGYLKVSAAELDELKSTMRSIRKLQKEKRKIDQQLIGMDDMATMLRKVRRMRIERVRKERAERKVQQAITKKERQAAKRLRRQVTPHYLGAGVSGGLTFDESDVKRLEANGLPVLQDAADLAKATGLTTAQISWLCYHRTTATIDHYHRFKIPKAKGGFRTIASPKPRLRQAQVWILEQLLNRVPLHDAAMAFRPNRNIADNARIHQNGGVIIRIDLKDFFPSILFSRVKGVFKSFGYNEGVSTLLALICTDAARVKAKLDDRKYFVALGQRYLPQGACTSPALTNIICRSLDNRLEKLSAKNGFTYTRYADDLVFSHPDKKTDLTSLINTTRCIIDDENFVMHPDKLMVMRPHNRQSVTGIVVNEQLNI